jgi:Fur family ferric uptake transcriptional regulator
MKDEAQGAIRAVGLRATRQRVALLAALLASPKPVSAEALAKRLDGELDLTTAYRALAELTQADLADRIVLPEGPALYEAMRPHHHHLVCRLCGRLEDVSMCLPSTLTSQVLAKSDFASVEDHSLEFFGLCMKCAKKR